MSSPFLCQLALARRNPIPRGSAPPSIFSITPSQTPRQHHSAVNDLLCRPQIYGEVPVTRFRHTGVVIGPEGSPAIQQAVNQLLHPAQRDASQGSMILMFGGYNTMGQEFGGDQFEVGVLHQGHSAGNMSERVASVAVVCAAPGLGWYLL